MRRPWPGYSHDLPIGHWINARRCGKRERRCLAALPGEGRCFGKPGHVGVHRAGGSADGMTYFPTPEMVTEAAQPAKTG